MVCIKYENVGDGEHNLCVATETESGISAYSESSAEEAIERLQDKIAGTP